MIGPGAGGWGDVDELASFVAEDGGLHREGLAEPGSFEDVAVGLEEVEVAVGVEIGQDDPEPEDSSGGRGEPEGAGGVGEGAVAEVPEADGRPAEEVGRYEVELAVGVDVADRHAHPGEGLPPAVEGDARGEADFLEFQVAAILEQPAGGAVIGDENVRSRVADEVSNDHAEPSAAGPVDPGSHRDVGECPVAVVPVEAVGLGGEVLGSAVVASAVGSRAEGGSGGVEVEIVGDVEVEVAVVVEVGEGGGGAPELRGQARSSVTSSNRPPPRFGRAADRASRRRTGRRGRRRRNLSPPHPSHKTDPGRLRGR